MQNWLNVKKITTFLSAVLLMCSMASLSFAATTQAPEAFFNGRTQWVAQQTNLLRTRLNEAQSELSNLQRQEENELTNLSYNQSNKQLRTKASLDIAYAKSNLDSINLELFESQQTINRLETEIQDQENQLNVFSIFGMKIERTEPLDVNSIRAELTYQKNLLGLEKTRSTYLQRLQKMTETILQIEKSKLVKINALLKSRTILQLKEQQAQAEVDFQQQQSVWLQKLNGFYNQLNQLEALKQQDKPDYIKLQRDIFFVNENVNFSYLRMLIVRYQDQLQQLKISISHSTSITLLNKASDQVVMLSRQVTRVRDLLKTRTTILEKRSSFVELDKTNPESQADLTRLTVLAKAYQDATIEVTLLDQKIVAFRTTLDQALQYELASRQGLPGFDMRAWLDLGVELWLVPALTFQAVKSLTYTLIGIPEQITYLSGMLLIILEVSWLIVYFVFKNLLARLVAGMKDHQYGHINLKWLLLELLRRNLLVMALMGNVYALFCFFKIPSQNINFIINIALVWLFFKCLVNMSRITLVETTHDHSGTDVRLYRRLKWCFLVGGVITTLTVFIQQLPVVYEVKDLFDRAFLLFLLVVSVFLLRAWDVVPQLILPHIDERRLYLKKVVLMLGFLVPFILLINSAIGLFGFVNLVLTISWYESVFVLVLVGYLLTRGLLVDGMMLVSSLVIRHVVNGWLWTEAFLKPLDKILRLCLFVFCWVVLFQLYGWDGRSPVVSGLNNLLRYSLVDMQNFSLTPLILLELFVFVSVFFWMARWAREFVFRSLAARTRDIGLRNSIAMFSQYLVVLIGIFVCLRVLNIDLETLKFVLGGFSIGIGLGLRDLANNYACGLLLLIERPVRVGDTVSINNYEGEITHIGGRAVTVRTWDNMEVLIPNADIFSKSFTNWTAKDYVVRSTISIKINRHDDPHKAQAVIQQVLSQQKDVLSDPHPEALLKELNDGLVEFEVRYFINLRQVKSRIALRSEVLMALWEAFESHGIRPSYPHQEIHIHGDMPSSLKQDVVRSNDEDEGRAEP